MLKISKAQIAHLISVPLVAVLTVGTAWLAKHFPGLPPLSNEIVAAAGLAVGTFAAATALHYLKGLREWQRLEGEGVISVDETTEQPASTAMVPSTDPPPFEGGAPGATE